MALTGRQFTIRAGAHEVTVVEVGAGLRRYARGGRDVTFTYADSDLPPKASGAVLVPWPNRVRRGKYTFDGEPQQLPLSDPGTGNASHGLGRWARWVPVHVDVATVTLALDIVPQTGWPFEVRVEVTYELHAEEGLRVIVVGRNAGSRRAPFGAGFHPYVALHGRPLGEVTVQVPASERIVVDETKIPVGNQAVGGTPYDLRRGRRLGNLRLDDAFTGFERSDGRAAIEVRTPDGGARVWFDEAFGFAQVYTPELIAREETAVAVEPMTCPADAFNSGTGLIVLEPGDTWTGTWGIQPL
jgi:aldose 1-epimerase